MVKRVDHGGNRFRGGITVQQMPRRVRRALRVSGPVAGALAALLATAAGWPGSAQPGVQHPAPSGTAPGSHAWLLSRDGPAAMPAAAGHSALPSVAPMGHLLPVDLVAVSASQFPAGALAAIRHLHGVHAALAVDAARVQVNGRFVAVLGVDPSKFRDFAAKPTAKDTRFWRSVAAGNLGISYTMGKQDKLPTGASATVAGRRIEKLPVGQLGTVGISGVDAVVSDTVADSLGFPEQNAIVINADRKASFAKLAKQIRKLLPHSAAVDQLVMQASPSVSGTVPAPPTSTGQSLNGVITLPQVRAFLAAAESRLGMPYVWGAAGPTSFDCSGLVQWSFRQAGITMPRVAADQARTGPVIPIRDLQPGDLLFYHTDPTAPGYISHVAIYLGGGKMIQAPEPGMDVEIVPVDLGSDFAQAVDVNPTTAAQVAATSV
jgi:cell wall-associated NlpC family hydrolase